MASTVPATRALIGASPVAARGRPHIPITDAWPRITEESIAQWLGTGSDDGQGELTGMAACRGVAEGPAPGHLQPGPDRPGARRGRLVAPLTAPSWALIFGNIRATLTDIGGIMSHAAIVCREYGLPAVTATASGTARIRTGQRIRVDGNTGTVTILDEDGECGRAALRGVRDKQDLLDDGGRDWWNDSPIRPSTIGWSHASPNGSGRWQQVHATRGDTQGLTR